MKNADLIATLQQFPDDAEVRLAFQPSWPFEHHIGDVVQVQIHTGEDEDDEYEDDEGEDIVYIAEGGQEGYLPGVVRDELGW